ncbi:E3 ubiquitin-protein ligase UPL4 [Olea europaea subsp. europaea]|uniref:E3 ubiquitin-protein ligase UPL4 n=1 Tax=Olea europaea subsp. europaea TaxID=158383 RepID=A0A8S0TWR7_OLEEU|nr:E3 ubiquitin-protein ligase UPL4 [Olea europaea subsp. europaea]
MRAITYLCDVNPRSSSFFIRQDVVPGLCQRLMEIEYLDVAEQFVESVVVCFIKIVEQESHSSVMLDELCKYGLVQQFLQLIDLKSQTTLCQTTYLVHAVLKLLNELLPAATREQDA